MRRLHGWTEAAGLRVPVDAAGNMVGRSDGIDPAWPVLMIGSFSRYRPNTGKYDGCWA